MKQVLSIVISLSFMLQTFATTIAMPINHILKVEQTSVVKKHSCCQAKKVSSCSTESKHQNKKDCCKGDAKMACCVVQVAIAPSQYQYKFIDTEFQKEIFYRDTHVSEYTSFFFQPPRLV